MSKGKELSNPHLEPTTSRISNVVSFPLYSEPRPAFPLPPSIPPLLPPRNPNKTSIKQYLLPSMEGGPGTLGIVEAANQHSFPTMTHIPFENTCLQSHRNKLKLALLTATLTVVMVTVQAVYNSLFKKKTEIVNISTNVNLTFNGKYIMFNHKV